MDKVQKCSVKMLQSVIDHCNNPLKCNRRSALENTVLTSIFGRNGDTIEAGWRKLHNDDLHNLYSSLGIVRMIISRKRTLAEYVARMGKAVIYCHERMGSVGQDW
jgi:hypothetical protein